MRQKPRLLRVVGSCPNSSPIGVKKHGRHSSRWNYVNTDQESRRRREPSFITRGEITGSQKLAPAVSSVCPSRQTPRRGKWILTCFLARQERVISLISSDNGIPSTAHPLSLHRSDWFVPPSRVQDSRFSARVTFNLPTRRIDLPLIFLFRGNSLFYVVFPGSV